MDCPACTLIFSLGVRDFTSNKDGTVFISVTNKLNWIFYLCTRYIKDMLLERNIQKFKLILFYVLWADGGNLILTNIVFQMSYNHYLLVQEKIQLLTPHSLLKWYQICLLIPFILGTPQKFPKEPKRMLMNFSVN